MENIINSLNFTEGAVLTLHKFEDRMEFEALCGVAGLSGEAGDCSENCSPYDPCHPYK